MRVVQDGPPPGGFPAIRYARRVPSSGPGGVTLFGVGIAVMAYGMYCVGQSNRERRANLDEKAQRRAALLPFLQAEEDRRWARAHGSWVEEQKRIMKDNPEFEAERSVYRTRWMPPAPRLGVGN